MSLDRQIQTLIEAAPQDGETPQAIADIAPILKALAQRLRHAKYYVLQTPNSNWLMTTLSNRTTPEQEKAVVYAFPSLEDARENVPESAAQATSEPLVAAAMPVTHLLFHMLGLERVDSLIFFEKPGACETGMEVKREELRRTIAQQLYQRRQPPPSDLA